MRDAAPQSPAVVVGIDGSRRALNAALWAVDEATERDLPLRVLYAIEPRTEPRCDSASAAHTFAVADSAVRHAAMAIESTKQPVKIEVEIVYSPLLPALLAASKSAVMLCVDAFGIGQYEGARRGAAVAELLSHTHCPVAIIGGENSAHGSRCIVTEFNGSPECPIVLERALEEARLRNAPLRVITGWRPTFTDVHDTHGSAEGTRHAKSALQRSLARYRRIYPDVDFEAVAVTGNPTNYLVKHADSIGLIVLGHDTANQLTALGDAGIYAALADLNCSMLIAPRHSEW